MKKRTIAGEILPVIGTIGFLGLWLYQQTGIEKRANELRQVNLSRSVYQTYQSHNAVFNAIEELASKDEATALTIRSYQIYNYELGLSALEKLLSPAEMKDVPISETYFPSTENIESRIDSTQKRLELLQEKIDKKEEVLKAEAANSNQKYFWAYVGFSIISICGAVLKVWDKIAEPKLSTIDK